MVETSSALRSPVEQIGRQPVLCRNRRKSLRCAPRAAPPPAASARPVGRKGGAQCLLGGQRRPMLQRLCDRAGELEPCCRKWPATPASSRRFSRATRSAPGCRRRHRVPRHRILQRGQPGRIPPPFCQQAVAPGHRCLMRGQFARMRGIERRHQAIESDPPFQAASSNSDPSAASARTGRYGRQFGLCPQRHAFQKHGAPRSAPREGCRCRSAPPRRAGHLSGHRPGRGPSGPKRPRSAARAPAGRGQAPAG